MQMSLPTAIGTESKQTHRFSLIFLISLPVLVFRKYLSGEQSPSWDFLGDYLTNSISWWNSGSFFQPAEYIPYAFSGYPAYLSAQSSAWYFPYAILDQVNLISSWPLAVLQVLTIVLGIIGFYFLSIKLGISRWVSLIIASAYLFTPGFFTSASHIDIVRAWAFMPWILIALFPRSKVSNWYIIGVTLLSFQYLISIYPGVIIASVYVFIVYIPLLLWLYKANLKTYFLYQLIPFLMGALMSLIKWLPFIFEERIFRGGNTVVVNQGIISTLIYPYQTIILPNDITMRSLFILPLLIFSVFCIKKINRAAFLFSIVGIFSLIFGFDFNQTDPWQNNLPLLGESRFRTTDFKLFLTISLLLLAGIGIEQIRKYGINPVRAGVALALSFSYVLILNRLAKNAGLLSDILIPGNTIARVSGVTFFLILILFSIYYFFKIKTMMYSGLAIYLLTTIFIGWYWALQSPAVWLNDRVASERFYYGETSSEINERVRDFTPTMRGKRSGPIFPIPYPAELTFQTWNKAEMEKSFTLGGYVSLKGIIRYENFIETAMMQEGANYFELLRQPLNAWLTEAPDAGLTTADCIQASSCLTTSFDYEIKNWSSNRIDFQITNAKNGLMVINEVPWKGWKAEVCSLEQCQLVDVDTSIEQKLVATPISNEVISVSFIYMQPMKAISWAVFWLAVGFLALFTRFNSFKSATSKLG